MTYFLRQFLRYNLGPVICIFWLRQKMQIYGPKLYRETDAGINNQLDLNVISLKRIVPITVDRKVQRVLEARAAKLRQHWRPRGSRVLLFED